MTRQIPRGVAPRRLSSVDDETGCHRRNNGLRRRADSMNRTFSAARGNVEYIVGLELFIRGMSGEDGTKIEVELVPATSNLRILAENECPFLLGDGCYISGHS